MDCNPCKQRQQSKRLGGQYALSCLSCCADLVISTRPDKKKAAAMLDVIERFGKFGRAQVLEFVRQSVEKHH